ncbi:hypothetical protein FS837_007875, partial [Tulasnella sp. UAMH 9824]
MTYTRALQLGLLLAFFNSLLSLIDSKAWHDSLFYTDSLSDILVGSVIPPKPPLAERAGALRRRHVAIATTFKYHAEVYGPFAWIAAKIFENQAALSSVHVYDDETEFVSLMKRLDQLPENVLRSSEKGRFVADVRSTALFHDDVGAMIDLIFLVTCEIDLPQLGPALLQAWDERTHDK